MCGVKTNIVTSVQVSDGYAHDYSFFKGLVDKTAQSGFRMKEVSADKGYLSTSNMLATLQHGTVPYIPFKSTSVPDSRGNYGPKSELWSRMYHFYALNRAEFLQHYHKRSNIETTFHMIKSKLGQRLRSRTLTAQVNEALCKVLVKSSALSFSQCTSWGLRPHSQRKRRRNSRENGFSSAILWSNLRTLSRYLSSL